MKYRAEIDGLRAVAVLPVIFFHAGFTTFNGGFVGVDVFFVISGYLITSLILEELGAGTFSLAGFYDRRARRILPSLFFVVLCTLPIAWALLLPNDLSDYLNSVMAVGLFSSNFLFYFQSGYFDTGAELKPLLHTWSLAVEEQFYIIFPLLLMALWGLGQRKLLQVLTGLFVVSLAYAHWGAYNQPSAAFFLLPARGWELLVGAFAAFYLRNDVPQTSTHVNNLLSVLGLLAITFTVFYFNEQTPFPSLYALVPTLGTVLIILFARSGTYVQRLLSLKACVGIGLISYSAYLWHQPIFVFARYLFGLPAGSYMFLALTGVSLFLAYLTWLHVERPFRTRKFSVKRVLTVSAFASAAILAIGFVATKLDNPQFDELAYSTHWEGWTECEPFGTREEAGGGCRILDDSRPPTLAVVGDSHAGHLATGLKKVYQGTADNPMILLSPGCYPAISQPNESEHFLNCDQDFIDKALAHISNESGISKVILSGFGNMELHNYGAHQNQKQEPEAAKIRKSLMRKGLREAVQVLLQSSKKLMLISDNPEMIEHPAHCSIRLARWFGTCPRRIPLSVVNERAREINQIISSVRNAFPALLVFDPQSVFCDGECCYSGTRENNWYQTRDHLTPAGSIALVERALDGF